MNTGNYSSTITYVDHTCGAVRPHHYAIVSAIRADGVLPQELEDVIKLSRAPQLNADGSVRWIVDWA